MKKAFIEVPLFFMIIFIAVTLMGTNLSKPQIKIGNLTFNEMSICTDTNKCQLNDHVLVSNNDGINLVKEIRSFLRKKLY